MPWLGYFTDPYQSKPAYNPPLDCPCPVCLKPLALPVKTISLMGDGQRSYFFRIHRACADDEAAVQQVEWSIIDAEAAGAPDEH